MRLCVITKTPHSMEETFDSMVSGRNEDGFFLPPGEKEPMHDWRSVCQLGVEWQSCSDNYVQ